MLAHHSVGGCPFRAGDLLGSGTVSGTERGSFGCLLEQTEGGKVPIALQDEQRIFLQDGDTVALSGVCKGQDYAWVGWGEVSGTVRPATSSV